MTAACLETFLELVHTIPQTLFVTDTSSPPPTSLNGLDQLWEWGCSWPSISESHTHHTPVLCEIFLLPLSPLQHPHSPRLSAITPSHPFTWHVRLRPDPTHTTLTPVAAQHHVQEEE